MAERALLLHDRHAVVTGAARGIGAAVARALAAQGARLTLMGRHSETLLALAGELVRHGAPHEAVAVDVTDAAAIARAFAQAHDRIGPVAILVNNAGQAESAPFARTTLDMWQRMLAVNLTGTFLCAQAALAGMTELGWGRVVNIASTAGLKGYPYVTAYAAAKHGVIGMTRSLALEVAARGITVNAVCPGYTETDLLKESIANAAARSGRSEEEVRTRLAAANPQGRMVRPVEVADSVLWLCSPGSSAVNGQALSVCGGEVM